MQGSNQQLKVMKGCGVEMLFEFYWLQLDLIYHELDQIFINVELIGLEYTFDAGFDNLIKKP